MDSFLKLSFLLLISCLVVENVRSFSLRALSEDTMSDYNQNKEAEYFKQISPSSKIRIGQVGGVAVDRDNNLVVFHRGSTHWRGDSFIGNDYNKEKYGAIKENVIAVIDTDHSRVVDSWGKNTFYMPHGLSIDQSGNVWLTDVGLHQVFKFNPTNLDEPDLILGIEFSHGSDENRLCKPTDVAVSKNGHVFVSDGYCNQRVVQFDKNGKYIKEFKDNATPLEIVHSVTLIEKLNLVCTVSREEGRIVCFDIESGDKKHEIVNKDMNTVYAINYNARDEVLHAVTGENHGADAAGFTFDATVENFGKLLNKWNADDIDLKEAHDLTVSRDGSQIYVGQLNGEIDEFTYQ